MVGCLVVGGVRAAFSLLEGLTFILILFLESVGRVGMGEGYASMMEVTYEDYFRFIRERRFVVVEGAELEIGGIGGLRGFSLKGLSWSRLMFGVFPGVAAGLRTTLTRGTVGTGLLRLRGT